MCAYIGFRWAFRTEKSVRGFALTGCIASGISALLGIGWEEFALVALAWFHVVQSEIGNTATEAVSDKASGKQYDPLVKKTKDFAAGSVFVANAAAWAVTLLFWGKKLLETAA